MFIQTRSQILISRNVLAGWKNASLKPFQPQKIFQELSFQQTFIFSWLFTFPETSALDLLLLANFFPNGIELRNANHAFKFTLQKSTDLFFPAKHYSKWMIQMYEIIHNKTITMHKKLKQQKIFFETCKKHSKNKKITLQNKFVFTTEEILQITKKTKSINAIKSVQKQPWKHPIQAVLDNKKKKC